MTLVFAFAAEFGNLTVRLQPHLSATSTAYVMALVGKCPTTPPDRRAKTQCNIYRVEAGSIIQGVLSADGIAPNTHLGTCPPDARAEYPAWAKAHPCPPYDPQCDCHGPWMVAGDLAWAGGGPGPDFFLSTQRRSDTPWHTVWGKADDAESLATVGRIFKVPTTNQGGLRIAVQPLGFTISLAP